MATLKGKGICWGVGTGGTINYIAGGVIIEAHGYQQSADFNLTKTKTKLTGPDGETVGLAYSDQEKTVTVTVLPADTDGVPSTIAQARLNAADLVPPPGTWITVTNANSTDVAGEYVCEAARARETNTGAMLIEIDMYQAVVITDYTDIPAA